MLRGKATDVAEQESAFAVTEMHAVALTVAEEPTVGTRTSTHPCTVAIGLEAMFPYIHEIVLVDIALVVVAADAGAG